MRTSRASEEVRMLEGNREESVHHCTRRRPRRSPPQPARVSANVAGHFSAGEKRRPGRFSRLMVRVGSS